jgi:hypothetical protein
MTLDTADRRNMTRRPDLAALAFCGLVVLAVAVLAALRVDVPDFLPTIGLVVAGVGGGVALNTSPNFPPADPVPASIPEAPAPVALAARVPAPRTDREPVPYATHAP